MIKRYQKHFQSKTRSVSEQAEIYIKGLAQADRKNMERMEECVVGADEQRLQHMLTNSKWDHRAVLDQVALEADKLLGGSPDTGLIVDESGFAKKGSHSAGVARQWCGRLGKVENCQVGVFSALTRDHRTTLIDFRLYLPKKWTDDTVRCLKAGIPDEAIVFKTKSTHALEMVKEKRIQGIRFSWVGADGGYGKEPEFLRGLDNMGETFVVDVHKNQRIYLIDPKPQIPEPTSFKGKKPSKLQAQSNFVQVDSWAASQRESAWQRLVLRDGANGKLQVDILQRLVWLWDGKEEKAHRWHLIIRREIDSPKTIKYTLSNAKEEMPTIRLAKMQAQRFWVERSLQDGKSESGMADYQARKWMAWHHHMALVLMAMLFMLEERMRQSKVRPLLSCSDVEFILKSLLPKKISGPNDVLHQLDRRHRKRASAIKSSYQRQGLATATDTPMIM